MKILVSHFGIFEKGGWGRTFSLAAGLAEIGYDITLLTNSQSYSLLRKKKFIRGVKVIIFPDLVPTKFTSKGFGIFSLILRFIYVMFRRFDIVHSDSGHRPLSGWPCLWNRFLYNSKYIAEWWDFFGEGGQLEFKPAFFKKYFGKFETWSEMYDKRKADGIIVLSKYMEKRANKVGISSNKIKIIHGGADITNISSLSWKTHKSSYGLRGEKLTFGYIGMSDGDIADLDPFLKAISKYKNKVTLVTFGKMIHKEYIDKYDLYDCMLEMGWVDYSKDSEKLSVVDIFILIKQFNNINFTGWPNKLGDYLACGRPVLITPYGDVTDFVNKYNNAFIVVDRDQKKIEENIEEIIAGKLNLKRMGDYARSIAESKISWQIKANELSTFYNEVLHKQKCK